MLAPVVLSLVLCGELGFSRPLRTFYSKSPDLRLYFPPPPLSVELANSVLYGLFYSKSSDLRFLQHVKLAQRNNLFWFNDTKFAIKLSKPPFQFTFDI